MPADRTPARNLLEDNGMTLDLDPAVLVGAAVGWVTLQLTSLGILVAVLRFFYLRLDRRFAEVDRRFAEVRTDMDRRFAEVDRRFAEAGADVDRRFAEVLAAMQTGFGEARDDRRRIEEKLDGQGKDLARLQGIVERTYEPHRFTVGAPDTTRTAPAPGIRHPGGAAGRRSDGSREPVIRVATPRRRNTTPAAEADGSPSRAPGRRRAAARRCAPAPARRRRRRGSSCRGCR